MRAPEPQPAGDHDYCDNLPAQDLKYVGGDECFLSIGNNNDIREYVSIHRSSHPDTQAGHPLPRRDFLPACGLVCVRPGFAPRGGTDADAGGGPQHADGDVPHSTRRQNGRQQYSWQQLRGEPGLRAALHSRVGSVSVPGMQFEAPVPGMQFAGHIIIGDFVRVSGACAVQPR